MMIFFKADPIHPKKIHCLLIIYEQIKLEHVLPINIDQGFPKNKW